MARRPLRFATFLAPNLYSVYASIARAVQEELGIPTELLVGSCYEQLYEEADVAFICGLAYIEVQRDGVSPVEPIAAPVLRGERYQRKPIYFSDVIVRRDSAFQSFADLRGCTWSFNEPYSHSGYGITRYHLARLGETNGFFGQTVEAGWHERSIQLVASGDVDASAIDSQVLAVELRDNPELAHHLRVIETMGPSTIQPVVVARSLPNALKTELRDIIVALGCNGHAEKCLEHGLVEHFVRVSDADYQDLRQMRDLCAAVNFLTLR
ncbi:MAG TPA: PhnD/SsuA/transferrin family substrate-binding protein [Gemmataceae bacterium]